MLVFKTLRTFAVRALGAGSALILTFVVTHSMGARAAGYFFIAFGLLNALGGLARAGMDNPILRFVSIAHDANAPGRVLALAKKSVLWTVVFSLLFVLPLGLFAGPIARRIYDAPELRLVLLTLALALPLFAALNILAQVVQGMRRISFSIVLRSIVVPLLAAGLILALRGYGPLDALRATWALALACFFGLVLAVASLLPFAAKARGQEPSPVPRREIWRSSAHLYVMVSMEMAVQWFAQLYAGAALGPADVARIATAQRVSMGASFILIAVNLVAAPDFAALHAKGELARLRKVTVSAARTILLVAVPAFLALLVWSTGIMGLFGADYAQGGVLLRILVCGQLVNALTGPAAQLLLMSGHDVVMRNVTVVSGIACVGLTVLLVHTHGAVGAALAIATVVALQNLALLWMVRRKLGFWGLPFTRLGALEAAPQS